MYRFTNLTDLNLTKNEISYIEDGAFAGQANLQVCTQQCNSVFMSLLIAGLKLQLLYFCFNTRNFPLSHYPQLS